MTIGESRGQTAQNQFGSERNSFIKPCCKSISLSVKQSSFGVCCESLWGKSILKMVFWDNLRAASVQNRPGEYNLEVLAAMDFVLDTARSLGLKVMLSFADNWKFLGRSAMSTTRHNFLIIYSLQWLSTKLAVIAQNLSYQVPIESHDLVSCTLDAAHDPMSIDSVYVRLH